MCRNRFRRESTDLHSAFEVQRVALWGPKIYLRTQTLHARKYIPIAPEEGFNILEKWQDL